MKKVLTIGAALFSASASAGVYRCEHDGRALFSDKPCIAGQEPLPIAELNTMETSAGDAALAREYDEDIAERRKRRDTFEEARAVARGDKPANKPVKAAKKKSEPKSRTARARADTRRRSPQQGVRTSGKPRK